MDALRGHAYLCWPVVINSPTRYGRQHLISVIISSVALFHLPHEQYLQWKCIAALCHLPHAQYLQSKCCSSLSSTTCTISSVEMLKIGTIWTIYSVRGCASFRIHYSLFIFTIYSHVKEFLISLFYYLLILLFPYFPFLYFLTGPHFISEWYLAFSKGKVVLALVEASPIKKRTIIYINNYIYIILILLN